MRSSIPFGAASRSKRHHDQSSAGPDNNVNICPECTQKCIHTASSRDISVKFAGGVASRLALQADQNDITFPRNLLPPPAFCLDTFPDAFSPALDVSLSTRAQKLKDNLLKKVNH